MGDVRPADALERLKAGNARFVAGEPRSDPMSARIAELAEGQRPFAVVLGCSDSRVPVEIVFDQAPGSLFVVRVAGNFLNSDGLGSIEFGVKRLKSSLVLVLGHELCGAVNAALHFVGNGVRQPGHIQDLVAAIAPAVHEARDAAGDWYANAIARNVERNVEAVRAGSPIIAEAVERGDVKVVGGIYSVRTGNVAFS